MGGGNGVVGDVLFWTLKKVKVYSRMLRTIVPVAVSMELKDGSAQLTRLSTHNKMFLDMSDQSRDSNSNSFGNNSNGGGSSEHSPSMSFSNSPTNRSTEASCPYVNINGNNTSNGNNGKALEINTEKRDGSDVAKTEANTPSTSHTSIQSNSNTVKSTEPTETASPSAKFPYNHGALFNTLDGGKQVDTELTAPDNNLDSDSPFFAPAVDFFAMDRPKSVKKLSIGRCVFADESEGEGEGDA
eukprot:gene24696-31070_t